MTSEERHAARYARRKAKREAARAARGHDFETVSSFGALRRAFYQARRGTNWKASVQTYGMNVLRNSYEISRKIRKGQKVTHGFIEFDVMERGKKRHICAVHIKERVVQKSVAQNGLVPAFAPTLIYENGACLKGKGNDFSSDRLTHDLRRYWTKYHTNEGYVLRGDAHNYFGSLSHDVLKKNLRGALADERLRALTCVFIDAFPDGVGLGLGSETSQISALGYANGIDHAVKQNGGKLYCRHMDDWYLICRTKEEARAWLAWLAKQYAAIGITLNEKKTQIVPLRHGFTWLKDRFYLTHTGKVIRKPGRQKVSGDRKRLRRLKRLMDKGLVTYQQVRNSYASLAGYYRRRNAWLVKRQLDDLYNELFINDWRYGNVPVSEQRQRGYGRCERRAARAAHGASLHRLVR